MPRTMTSYMMLPLHSRLFFETAPVRENLKPSVLFHLKSVTQIENWWDESKDCLEKLGLESIILYQHESLLSLLVYQKIYLENHLNEDRHHYFLKRYGYQHCDHLDDYFDILQKIYSPKELPHEIGIFLGYPLEDVIGFIKHKGKNSRLSKYWKVYGDVEKAVRLFAQIDQSKQKAAQLLFA